MFVSKIKSGRTGNPEFKAWYKPALSSNRKSRRNQKIFIGLTKLCFTKILNKKTSGKAEVLPNPNYH
jgi:hypothetical protein